VCIRRVCLSVMRECIHPIYAVPPILQCRQFSGQHAASDPGLLHKDLVGEKTILISDLYTIVDEKGNVDNFFDVLEQECKQRCHNLPFGGRAARDSRVRLPRKEYARSHHQCLFEENVGKIRKDVVFEL